MYIYMYIYIYTYIYIYMCVYTNKLILSLNLHAIITINYTLAAKDLKQLGSWMHGCMDF